jgi:ABC-type Zn uptake system ZnuABC Zn-binding protein ZnuA
MDPMVVMSLAENIGQALMRLDPEHSQEYGERVAAYQKQLRALDERIQQTVEQFRIREYVAFHPAWSYFARRYGLVEVGVIQESPGREPTPKHLQSIIRAIQDHGIQAVFAEPQLNPSAASAIASEAGVKVLILDPLGGAGVPGRDSYIDLMEYNLKMMRGAMR